MGQNPCITDYHVPKSLAVLRAHPSTLNSPEEKSWQKITAGRSGLGSSYGQNLKQNMLKTSPGGVHLPNRFGWRWGR
jgi:hypothetical protein